VAGTPANVGRLRRSRGKKKGKGLARIRGSPLGAYLTSLWQERIVREWNSPRAIGYQRDAKDRSLFSSVPDGRHFFHVAGRAKDLAEIANFSKHDAEVYPTYAEATGAHQRRVEDLLLTTARTTAAELPPSSMDALYYLGFAGKKLRCLAPRISSRWSRGSRERADSWTNGSQARGKVHAGYRRSDRPNGGPPRPHEPHPACNRLHGARC